MSLATSHDQSSLRNERRSLRQRELLFWRAVNLGDECETGSNCGRFPLSVAQSFARSRLRSHTHRMGKKARSIISTPGSRSWGNILLSTAKAATPPGDSKERRPNAPHATMVRRQSENLRGMFRQGISAKAVTRFKAGMMYASITIS
jgi:hypothetical protein